MERVIKFRSYCPIMRTMMYNVGIESSNELMQYTGLKDKNGKEIYEGDIIKIDDSIGVIVWDRVRWAIASGEIGNYHGYDYFTSEIMGEIEVIGNIYENPNYTKL